VNRRILKKRKRFGSTIDFYFHPDTHISQYARNKNPLTIEKGEIRLDKRKINIARWKTASPWLLSHMN
jgi:hypothetical protein